MEPTDAPLYVSDLDKALEYGEEDQVVMFFDRRRLDRTFRKIDAWATPEEIAAVRRTYSTEEGSQDGCTIWFSRLALDDARRTTDYEVGYGRWIPGDPFDALIGLCLVGPAGRGLPERMRAEINGCSAVRWH